MSTPTEAISDHASEPLGAFPPSGGPEDSPIENLLVPPGGGAGTSVAEADIGAVLTEIGLRHKAAARRRSGRARRSRRLSLILGRPSRRASTRRRPGPARS